MYLLCSLWKRQRSDPQLCKASTHHCCDTVVKLLLIKYDPTNKYISIMEFWVNTIERLIFYKSKNEVKYRRTFIVLQSYVDQDLESTTNNNFCIKVIFSFFKHGRLLQLLQRLLFVNVPVNVYDILRFFHTERKRIKMWLMPITVQILIYFLSITIYMNRFIEMIRTPFN